MSKLGRNDKCYCGSGKKYKKCCLTKDEEKLVSKKRLLVVGAGALLEECAQSGAEPSDQFPVIANFANKIFDESYCLQAASAIYLEANKIPFNPEMIRIYKEAPGGITIPEEVIQQSPLEVFKRLERENSKTHNVEKLFEHVWHAIGPERLDFWDAVSHSGVYLQLSLLFIRQFGVNGNPKERYRHLKAGAIICQFLGPGDRVINLNYDVAFDVALKQSSKQFCYAPGVDRNGITVYKPHGSFNLYTNRQQMAFQFIDVDRIPGTLVHPDPKGGEWSATPGIVPPRLRKEYQQHPIAHEILESLSGYKPDILTFWGVGMTSSDADLMQIYKAASETSGKIEFINPSVDAYNAAKQLFNKDVRHNLTLGEWQRDQSNSDL